jgi:peptidoglycan/xylan/chitin deacetylase (PgdA/CDA1 family)
MTTPVFLTIEAGMVWRHLADGLQRDEVVARSLDPAGVGLPHMLSRLRRCGLRATFFVDPMPALVFGLDSVRELVEKILDAGQEVQLGLHPHWASASSDVRQRFALAELSGAAQRDLIEGAVELLVAAGAPSPVAFRAAGHGAGDDTLDALSALGFVYDSSFNGAVSGAARISLPSTQIAPLVHRGVIEVPATIVGDRSGTFRTFRVGALSIGEMRDALDHALAEGHAAVTILGHISELANRAGTRANAIHVRRFDAMCAMLGERAGVMPTIRFADRVHIPLGRGDPPFASGKLHTTWRKAEQLWTSIIEDRAA